MPTADCDCDIARGAHDLVCIQPTSQAANRFPPHILFHAAPTAFVEIDNYSSMTVVFFMAVLVEELINERGNAALLPS